MFSISPEQAYSFVVDFLNNSVQSFLISSFHSTISILLEALRCSSHQVSSHGVKFSSPFLPFLAGVLSEFFHAYLFSTLSNRSGFRVYLIPWAFDSRHIRRSSFRPERSWTLFIFSLAFLFHLFLFIFHLIPKISGRDLLLVEESCNAPNPMRQVSSSYSPSLPCLLLACCTLPFHHLHFVCRFFKTCVRSGSPGSLRCPFWAQPHLHAPAAPPKYYLYVA